ncbi:MAG: VCBS repeat-containing protein [Bacteroidales bacterium]
MQGFYSRDEEGKWLNFRNFAHYPNINFKDANLRFMDLTNNGLMNVIISQGTSFDIYFSEGKSGYGMYRKVHCGNHLGDAPQLVFSDSRQRVFLADMSGDGLTDIVRITNASVTYYPKMGYGRFGTQVVMGNSPLLDSLDQFDTRYLYLADVDGTGTTDILYILKGQIRYFKNLSGNAWSEQELPSTVYCNNDQQTHIQVLDILGNGTQCVVVTSSLPSPVKKMRYLELTSGIKPFSLQEIKNSRGGITRLHYALLQNFICRVK